MVCRFLDAFRHGLCQPPMNGGDLPTSAGHFSYDLDGTDCKVLETLKRNLGHVFATE
jgi:hypothetical protein